MLQPCEIVVKYVLPSLRAMVAKELIEKYDFTQATVAQKLGVTQAAISWYMIGKRGGADKCSQISAILERNQSVNELVKELARGIADSTLASSASVQKVCNTCITAIRPSQSFCQTHMALSTMLRDCGVCHALTA